MSISIFIGIVCLIVFYVFLAFLVLNRSSNEDKEARNEYEITINQLIPGTTFMVDRALEKDQQYEIVILEMDNDKTYSFINEHKKRLKLHQGLIPKKVVYKVSRNNNTNCIEKIFVPGLSYV